MPKLLNVNVFTNNNNTHLNAAKHLVRGAWIMYFPNTSRQPNGFFPPYCVYLFAAALRWSWQLHFHFPTGRTLGFPKAPPPVLSFIVPGCVPWLKSVQMKLTWTVMKREHSTQKKGWMTALPQREDTAVCRSRIGGVWQSRWSQNCTDEELSQYLSISFIRRLPWLMHFRILFFGAC